MTMKTQNLRGAPKAVLREKLIAIQVCLKKWEKYQINDVTISLKQLEKEEQKTPKLVEWKKP